MTRLDAGTGAGDDAGSRRERAALRIGLVGPGAVGLGVASLLHQAGAALHVVARPATAARLAREGLGRTGLFGAHRAPSHELVVDETVAAWRGRTFDAVLVCTKATASPTLAAALAEVWPTLARPAPVVLFHNGWGSAEIFAARVPRPRVYNARVITGFRRLDATTSEITVHAEPVHLGSLFGAPLDPVRPIADALAAAGLPSEAVPDLARDLWAKMLYNCALNPLGALRGVRYGALAEDPTTRRLLEAAVRETFCAMRAEGDSTHWPSADAYLADFYARILPPTASHESSMLQDLRAHRPTEIDFLSGAVARIGERHGLATPVSAALRDLVRAIEESRGVTRDGAAG